MKSLTKILMTLAILTNLTACDYHAKKDLRDERENPRYREAMSNYQAGRLDQAVKGFSEVIREDPANATARFQLACLLQDAKKDFVGAFCAYHEYLMQHPESDKAKIATRRAASCEHELARTLAAKYGLDTVLTFAKETDKLKKDLKFANERSQKLDADLAAAMRKIVALKQENERLLSTLKQDDDAPAPSIAKIREAKDVLEDDSDGTKDRIATSADIAVLRLEGEQEMASASDILPVQAPDAKAKRDESEKAAARAKEAAAQKNKEPPHEKRPHDYVVQEGDTLTRIAIRFYGTASAWKKIREANKVQIPTTGRVNVGCRIVLP